MTEPINTNCSECLGQPASAPQEVIEENTLDNEPKIRVKNSKVASQALEQPNQNAMIFEQIDGACKVIIRLLNELRPKTNDAEDCIITHKAWEDNNLKHLIKAYE